MSTKRHWADEMSRDMDEHPEWFGLVIDEMGNPVPPEPLNRESADEHSCLFVYDNGERCNHGHESEPTEDVRPALRVTEPAGVLDRVLAERDAWKTLHDAKSGPYNYGNQEHLRIIRRARVLLSALSLRDALDTETTE